IEPEKSLVNFLFFVAFFPQLIAGPIVRAKEFLPQIKAGPKLDLDSARLFMLLFMVGFFKKAVIADYLSSVLAPYFDAPESFSALSFVTACWGFSAQLYCDFSGYAD